MKATRYKKVWKQRIHIPSWMRRGELSYIKGSLAYKTYGWHRMWVVGGFYQTRYVPHNIGYKFKRKR